MVVSSVRKSHSYDGVVYRVAVGRSPMTHAAQRSEMLEGAKGRTLCGRQGLVRIATTNPLGLLVCTACRKAAAMPPVGWY
jgi:hypothetical protein